MFCGCAFCDLCDELIGSHVERFMILCCINFVFCIWRHSLFSRIEEDEEMERSLNQKLSERSFMKDDKSCCVQWKIVLMSSEIPASSTSTPSDDVPLPINFFRLLRQFIATLHSLSMKNSAAHDQPMTRPVKLLTTLNSPINFIAKRKLHHPMQILFNQWEN